MTVSSCAPIGQKRRLFKDAGRACPVDYRIAPDAFAGEPEVVADVLYVVGGLYGNPFAAQAIDALVASEQIAAAGADEDDVSKSTNANHGANPGANTGPIPSVNPCASQSSTSSPSAPINVNVVLNGDIHWFDKTAENFADIERRIGKYIPLVGNVEAELRRQDDIGVGCGCAYPDCTSDDSVARSNRIHKMLSFALESDPGLKRLLENRPSTLLASVAGKRIAITHGDEKLLGGWDNSREALQDILRQDEVDTFMADNDLDVFTTTHTCAPAAIKLARGVVVNNGAAGLPNFAGEDFGLCIRIATCPREDSLFECELDGLFIQAIPVRYDHTAYLKWFDGLWPETSAAAISYRSRIVDGAEDRIRDSLLGGFRLGETARAELEGLRERELEESGALHRATNLDVHKALESLLYFDDMIDDDSCRVTEEDFGILQMNITAKCNIACAHCHVESSPVRTEAMSHETLEAVLKVARERGFHTIDITGGAPEMHAEFEWFLKEACAAVPNVMVRSNLVILQEPGYEHLMDLYAQLGVEVVASLPNVFEAESDAQRGRNTYDVTLEMLRRLNALGYGSGEDGAHILDVVFNPQEPVLPPAQEDVEEMYRRRLGGLGISFDNLFAVANNPIGRYGAKLLDDGTFEGYMAMLMDAFNPDTCPGIMCRHQMNVGWDGTVYDCDFNHAIRLQASAARLEPGELTRAKIDRALLSSDGERLTIFDYANDSSRPLRRPIVFANHCYACTAGFGSSCGGTLVQE